MYKNKSNKYVRILVLTILCMALLSTVAMAETFHYGHEDWSIGAADTRSEGERWVALVTSTRWYITSKADTRNVGAETTYYKVAIKSSGASSSQIACNLIGYSNRSINAGEIEENESNLTYAWRVDSTLNTSIVDGYTNIYSRY